MKMNKRAFVLMETIVVVTVLSVILIMLYAAYAKILIDVKKKSLYDNTEYIYKTNLVKNYLEDSLDPTTYNGSSYYIYCSDRIDKKCYDETVTNNLENELFHTLRVKAVYITLWDVNKISATELASFEATTRNYIDMMDPKTDSETEGKYRIIVMFEQENNDTSMPIYEYATLRFGSRR